jgi:hypothetical protein
MTEAPAGTCGYIYAATGTRYVTLARRSARNLRQLVPDASIDLFTDQSVTDPVFDQVHQVDRISKRPKMEALRRSRFDKTIYMDADTMVIAPIGDIFAVLDHFDIALTHAQFRVHPPGGNTKALPAAFPQLNSGLVGLRRSTRTADFLRQWEGKVLDTGAKYDQPALRQLLFQSADMRLAVLPPEYNFIRLIWLEAWDHTMGAPRMLHLGTLNRSPEHLAGQPFDLEKTVGRRLAQHLRNLIMAEPAVGGTKQLKVEAPVASGLWRVIHRLRRIQWRLMGR